jgi:LmbE family N-acetylglucosaminyl deacetylase
MLDRRGADFLTALQRPDREALSERIAVVVAHPDDETIGCGAQLPRFRDVTILHVTDGAPRNGRDATARGFPTVSDYAAARRLELEAAMALAGIPPNRLLWLGCSDQEASLHIVTLARKLAEQLAETEIVLTHAYEGGHPDHDATAFSVHAACAMLADRAPAIVEMPLYRAGSDGRLAQTFAPHADAPEAVLHLDAAERELKGGMLAAHLSQQEVLGWFTADAERFRVAPKYDFTRPPNGGDVLYEGQDWSMTGARWLQLAAATRAELGLGGKDSSYGST